MGFINIFNMFFHQYNYFIIMFLMNINFYYYLFLIKINYCIIITYTWIYLVKKDVKYCFYLTFILNHVIFHKNFKTCVISYIWVFLKIHF
jgi:hypothetical protein